MRDIIIRTKKFTFAEILKLNNPMDMLYNLDIGEFFDFLRKFSALPSLLDDLFHAFTRF